MSPLKIPKLNRQFCGDAPYIIKLATTKMLGLCAVSLKRKGASIDRRSLFRIVDSDAPYGYA
ncbi:hypothetical protein [Microcoleus sp. herbarium12]|uniref:hypothetical protein n=1 Tax=Microcoleus sp. herbarium12 TaxID=3055437 RepID=UPI002FCFE345